MPKKNLEMSPLTGIESLSKLTDDFNVLQSDFVFISLYFMFLVLNMF